MPVIDSNGKQSYHGLVCATYQINNTYWAAIMEPREDGSMSFTLVKTNKLSASDATPELYMEYRKWASDTKRSHYIERKQLAGFIAGSEHGSLGVGARVTTLPAPRSKKIPGGAVGTVFWEGENKFKIGEMSYGVEYTEYDYDEQGNSITRRGSGFLPRERLVVMSDYPAGEIAAAKNRLEYLQEQIKILELEFKRNK
jgi:hypothetical protein